MPTTLVYQGNLPDFFQTELFSDIMTVFFALMLVAVILTMRHNRYFKPAVLLIIAVYFLTLALTYSPFLLYNVKYNASSNTTVLYLNNAGSDYGTIVFGVAIALVVFAFMYFFYVVVSSLGFRSRGDVDVY